MTSNQSVIELIDGPRACDSFELGPAMDVGTDVMRISRGRPPTWGRSWPHIFCEENRENIRIIKVNHQVVSTMAIFPTEVQAGTVQGESIELVVGGISGVATYPEFRRRGFASQLMHDCQAKMRTDGCDIALLSTGIDNWYRGFGWERGAEAWTFEVDRGSVSYLPRLENTTQVEEITYNLSALARVVELHQQEVLGARRRPEHSVLLITRIGCRIYSASKNGRLQAYLVLRDNHVCEYCGQPSWVAGLIRTVFEELDDSSFSTTQIDERGLSLTLRMSIHTPPIDVGLGKLFYEQGLPHGRRYLGMIYIVNPQQLFEKIGVDVVVEKESVEGDGKSLLLRYDSHLLQMNQRQLVKLIFGPERSTSPLSNYFPLSFYQWPLDLV
ncbi:MAG: GNAT family N-acetyltransferase [Chloroflexota bacterium]